MSHAPVVATLAAAPRFAQRYRLLNLRPHGSAVLATLEHPGGRLVLIWGTKVDQPGLEHLRDRDRATVQAAVLALTLHPGVGHAA